VGEGERERGGEGIGEVKVKRKGKRKVKEVERERERRADRSACLLDTSTGLVSGFFLSFFCRLSSFCVAPALVLFLRSMVRTLLDMCVGNSKVHR
jgi:hypothetical protein